MELADGTSEKLGFGPCSRGNSSKLCKPSPQPAEGSQLLRLTVMPGGDPAACQITLVELDGDVVSSFGSNAGATLAEVAVAAANQDVCEGFTLIDDNAERIADDFDLQRAISRSVQSQSAATEGPDAA